MQHGRSTASADQYAGGTDREGRWRDRGTRTRRAIRVSASSANRRGCSPSSAIRGEHAGDHRAVGIKQPSLFHYFAGKEAIGHELIAARLAPTTLLTGQFEHSEDDPALDLYRLFRNEMIVEFNETIDTRWLFRQPPAVAELFPEWGEAVEAGRSTMEAVLERGIRAGVFLPGHPKAVLELFDAIANEAMFWPRDLHSVQPDTFARCSCVSSSPTSPRSPRWSSERRRPRDTWLRFEAGHRRRRHDC